MWLLVPIVKFLKFIWLVKFTELNPLWNFNSWQLGLYVYFNVLFEHYTCYIANQSDNSTIFKDCQTKINARLKHEKNRSGDACNSVGF